ncbi:MAG: hypothetical protein J6D15_01620 [Clostridia bacterium]|nr:hypothetical protein [Clostridia bacterium]
MCDPKLQEIIDLYQSLGIEDVDSVKNEFDVGEVDGRNLSKNEEKNTIISYTASVNTCI